MKRDLLFPTPIYFKTLPNSIALNKKLTKDIISWSKTAPTETKTNAGEGWHSPTIMHTKSEYNTLQKEIMIMADEVFEDWKVEPKAMMGNMWANINYPGSFNIEHMHPNSVLSGAYYIKIPKESGTIYVVDPRAGPNILMPRRLPDLPPSLWRILKYPPYEGQCIMFPAWLPHGVESNKSKTKGQKSWRLSVSFNIYQGTTE